MESPAQQGVKNIVINFAMQKKQIVYAYNHVET